MSAKVPEHYSQALQSKFSTRVGGGKKANTCLAQSASRVSCMWQRNRSLPGGDGLSTVSLCSAGICPAPNPNTAGSSEESNLSTLHHELYASSAHHPALKAHRGSVRHPLRVSSRWIPTRASVPAWCNRKALRFPCAGRPAQGLARHTEPQAYSFRGL